MMGKNTHSHFLGVWYRGGTGGGRYFKREGFKYICRLRGSAHTMGVRDTLTGILSYLHPSFQLLSQSATGKSTVVFILILPTALSIGPGK